jgi:plasmid stabilization system protein ParE
LKRSISFHYLAEIELNEAAEYYDRERPGLGIVFLAEVERAVEFVLELPEGSPRVARTVRRKLLRRFPYGILYSVRPNEVRILAIMNHKRRPFYWRGRK